MSMDAWLTSWLDAEEYVFELAIGHGQCKTFGVGDHYPYLQVSKPDALALATQFLTSGGHVCSTKGYSYLTPNKEPGGEFVRNWCGVIYSRIYRATQAERVHRIVLGHPSQPVIYLAELDVNGTSFGLYRKRK